MPLSVSHGRRQRWCWGWREAWSSLCPAEGQFGHSGSDLYLRNSRFPTPALCLKGIHTHTPPSRTSVHQRTGLLSLLVPWGTDLGRPLRARGRGGREVPEKKGKQGTADSEDSSLPRGMQARLSASPTGCMPTHPHLQPLCTKRTRTCLQAPGLWC